jgi:hypothetical protein
MTDCIVPSCGGRKVCPVPAPSRSPSLPAPPRLSHLVWVLRIQGTFYRNGPGILELGGERMHVFDSHGLVAKVAIKDGRAVYCSRFTRTKVCSSIPNLLYVTLWN